MTTQELLELGRIEQKKRDKLKAWHKELIKLGKLEQFKRLQLQTR